MTDKLSTTGKAPSIYSTMEAFEDGQRIAKALSSADLVPAAYKNNIPNTMIALEMANRINVSPFMVMQNLDIIKGKPSWSSTFIISAINSCGRFTALSWEIDGEDPNDENYRVRAVAKSLEDGEMKDGTWITWKMVKAEGWLAKSGSKWKTMPELMFRYRSASFFGRLHAPDLLKGMQSVEEQLDINNNQNMSSAIHEQERQEIIELLDAPNIKIPEADRQRITEILDNEEVESYQKALKNLQKLIPEANDPQ